MLCTGLLLIGCAFVQAQAVEEKGGAVEAPPADIRSYLKPTGLMEIRYIRMLSSLCNETYYLSKLSVSYLTPHVPLYWLSTMHVSQTSYQRAQQRVMSTLVLPLTACLFLQKRTIRLRHKLDLVTTSHECAHVAKEVPRTAAQIMEDGDAMASTPQQAETAQQVLLESSQNTVPAMEVSQRRLCMSIFPFSVFTCQP